MQPYGDDPGDLPDEAGTVDEWLADLAVVALREDPAVHGPYMKLMVQNRVVILEGEAASAEAREAAGRRAWTVPGVHDVCNELTVTAAGR